jgi:hypothetical protein
MLKDIPDEIRVITENYGSLGIQGIHPYMVMR